MTQIIHKSGEILNLIDNQYVIGAGGSCNNTISDYFVTKFSNKEILSGNKYPLDKYLKINSNISQAVINEIPEYCKTIDLIPDCDKYLDLSELHSEYDCIFTSANDYNNWSNCICCYFRKKCKNIWFYRVPVPECIGYISCDYLDLDGITSEVPESIGNINDIKRLRIRNSTIKDLPNSITNLKTLEILEIVICEKAAKLPDDIGNLTNLTKLVIDGFHAYIGGETVIPESIGNLDKLTYLQISDSYVKTLPESMSKLINVTNIDLSDNELFSLPDWFDIFNKDDMEWIHLEYNHFTEDYKEYIKNELLPIPYKNGKLYLTNNYYAER